MLKPKESVRRGYDRISCAYRDDEGGGIVSDYEHRNHTDEATYVEWLTKRNCESLASRFVPKGNGGHTLLTARERPE